LIKIQNIPDQPESLPKVRIFCKVNDAAALILINFRCSIIPLFFSTTEIIADILALIAATGELAWRRLACFNKRFGRRD